MTRCGGEKVEIKFVMEEKKDKWEKRIMKRGNSLQIDLRGQRINTVC